MAGFGTFLTYLFFFTTGRRKDEADVKHFKYSVFLNLSVNVQIIYIIQIFNTELSERWFLCNLKLNKVISSS